MKLSLKVMTAGKWEGKVIPITLAQFVIGRDPQCHLRPASPLISKRHCAFLVKDRKVFLRDFGSTNGTQLNDQPVKGEAELKNKDHVKVGPIEFEVQLELPTPTASTPVNQPTPIPETKVPPKKVAQPSDEDSAGDLLLSLLDDGAPPTPSGLSDKVPDGSTVMDIPAVSSNSSPGVGSGSPPGTAPAKKDEKPKSSKETTADAAKQLLEKYMKGKR